MNLLDRGNKIALAVILPIAVLVGGIYVVAAEERRQFEEQCNRLMAIAKDPHKVRYVREWVASRAQDEQFMTALDAGAWFDHRDPIGWDSIDLDSRELGFAPTIVDFNDGYGADIRARGLMTIGLHEGRSSIIIKLNPAAEVGEGWGSESLEKLVPVGDGVFVLCEH